MRANCLVHCREMSGLSFTDKVVLVTGASSTVGSELAKYFSKLGASLVLTDCDKYRLNKVGDECSGVSVLNIAADLTKTNDVTSVIRKTIGEFKKLDVLINYVDPLSFKAGGQTPIDVFKLVIDLCVCSVYSLTQSAHPYLMKTGGCVINVHGLLSHNASNDVSCKVSSSALDELTRSLASQYSCDGIRVNAVSAGSIENLQGDADNPLDKSVVLKRTHLGPEDIAAAVVFLASDLATFISGANLPVGGGKRLTGAVVKGTAGNLAGSSQEKSSKGAARSNPSKSENCQPEPRKKEVSHSESIAEHSKHKEPTKQSPAKHADARKTDADKSATAKHQGSERISKPATKNN